MKTEMVQPATMAGHDTQLRDPEFYRVGLAANVICDYGRTVRVHREGHSRLEQQDGDTVLITATDFRNAWGASGEIPTADQGWDLLNNGWFSLYTECGRPIDQDGDVHFDLPEAIEAAQQWLTRTGRVLLATAVQAAA